MHKRHKLSKKTCYKGSSVGLFAGVGGIDLGFQHAGIKSHLLCEILPEARHVLRRRFPDVELAEDVTRLVERKSFSLPNVDIVSAGFPCQDLSQCGRTAGIHGDNSGLFDTVVQLLSRRKRGPRWLVIENVPFMLRLDHGRAISHLTASLEELGYTWAYRIVDARSFGLPQRRKRVILVASKTEDPRTVLFCDNSVDISPKEHEGDTPRGFSWTEGNRGLGWAFDSVPTLKAGSSIGIPSPPAIWLPAYNEFVTPTIEDVEAMQGFPRGWTSLSGSIEFSSSRPRWRLVGNAVPVPIATWLGKRLLAPGDIVCEERGLICESDKWPNAAWGRSGKKYEIDATLWPVSVRWRGLADRYGSSGERLRTRPQLSARAADGFYRRLMKSSLRQSKNERFVESLESFVERTGKAAV